MCFVPSFVPAELAGNLWEYNVCKVVIVDVTDDYRLMQPPMPSECYPVLKEVWLPTYGLKQSIPAHQFVNGYLYDWHEQPGEKVSCWYVGVVSEELATIGKA